MLRSLLPKAFHAFDSCSMAVVTQIKIWTTAQQLIMNNEECRMMRVCGRLLE